MTSSALISAHQYADDAAFRILTVDSLQRYLDVISETCPHVVLIVNTTKTEVLSASLPNAPTFPFAGNSLKTLKISFTWAQISHFLVT